MSLFQTREWWSVKPESEDECGHGCLAVANIDDDPQGSMKIISGSYNGILRIFYPKQKGYKIDDLILEQKLEAPILQIKVGHFVSNQTRLALAVLHPKKLVVFTVVPVGGTGLQTKYYNLTKSYEHILPRSCYNFCTGHFGGSNHEHIVVQSLDGQLFFLEQANFAFTRYLPDFLLPGPITYVSDIDAFVTCTSDMNVCCYKYQVLSSSGNTQQNNDLENKNSIMSSRKKVQSHWKINIGEHALDLFLSQISSSSKGQSEIIILGEKSIFTLALSGILNVQRRWDYNPLCFCVYDASNGQENNPNKMNNLIVGSQQSSLMVYTDLQLIWAAKTNDIPVSITVSKFNNINGLVVQLNEDCTISVCYMGTDPPLQGRTVADERELNYEAMDKEHRKLLRVIKQASTNSLAEPKDKIIIDAQVANEISHSHSKNSNIEFVKKCAKDEHGKYYTCDVRLLVHYTGNDVVKDVIVNISVPNGFLIDKTNYYLSDVGNEPIMLELTFYCSCDIIPCTLNVQAIACYASKNNAPRTSRCEFPLPLSLALQVSVPLKNARFFYVVESSHAPPSLQTLFPDLFTIQALQNTAIANSSNNIMTVLFHAKKIDATILVSVQANRFKLQSGVFEALSLLSSSLDERLYNYYASVEIVPEFALSFKDDLPMGDFFNIIQSHWDNRNQIDKLNSELENAAKQFRVVQKRLLVRFTSNGSSPLNMLDELLKETYHVLLSKSRELENCLLNVKERAHSILCTTQLICLLLKWTYQLNERDYHALTSCVAPVVSDTYAQGWEEVCDAGITYLLRTTLTKSKKDKANQAQPLVPMADIGKLFSHWELMIRRLDKGLRPTEQQQQQQQQQQPEETKEEA